MAGDFVLSTLPAPTCEDYADMELIQQWGSSLIDSLTFVAELTVNLVDFPMGVLLLTLCSCMKSNGKK